MPFRRRSVDRATPLGDNQGRTRATAINHQPIKNMNESKKWTLDTTNPPGKVQLGRVNKALANLRSEHYTTIEKSGIIGKTDGYDRESEYSTVRYCIGGENAERADVRAAQDSIGEKYSYTVSRDNAGALVADIEAALVTLAAGRVVNDKRETQAQADARIAARTAENAARQAEDDRRSQELIDLTTAAYGEPGRTVHLSPGETGIVAVLCFDNSDPMSDYFDSHATLGVPLLVGTMRSNRETEQAARGAIRRFPGLSDEQHGWQWKTEKWSMGHGNYLTGSGVDVDPALGATRTRYGAGGPITKGHWEIQFTRGWQKDHAFSVFRGYFDQPDPQTSTEADAAADARASGGALGTVRHNAEHNGCEISFFEKPTDALRAQLQRAGFRITRRPPWKWYTKWSEAAYARACELAGVTVEAVAAADPAGAYVEAQENAFCDAQAAACGA